MKLIGIYWNSKNSKNISFCDKNVGGALSIIIKKYIKIKTWCIFWYNKPLYQNVSVFWRSGGPNLKIKFNFKSMKGLMIYQGGKAISQSSMLLRKSYLPFSSYLVNSIRLTLSYGILGRFLEFSTTMSCPSSSDWIK